VGIIKDLTLAPSSTFDEFMETLKRTSADNQIELKV
jgi:hypothetical protein